MESARYTNLPFFWLLTRNQDFFDKKCCILTFRDKKVSYFNVLRQKSVVFQRFATKSVIHILMCLTLLKHAKTVFNTVKACYDAKTVFNTVKAF